MFNLPQSPAARRRRLRALGLLTVVVLVAVFVATRGGSKPATVTANYLGETGHLPSAGQTSITLKPDGPPSNNANSGAGHGACSALRGAAATRCRLNQQHSAALAACHRLKPSRRAACVKRANGAYQRALKKLATPTKHHAKKSKRRSSRRHK